MNHINLDDILHRASLDIVDFAHQIRYEMDTRNRVLPYYVMTYLKSGRAYVQIREQIYHCGPGTVALIPAGVVHDHIAHYNPDDPAVFLWWHFTYMLAGSVDVLRLFNWPITFEVRQGEQFEELFSDYLNYAQGPATIPNSILAKARSLEILALLFGNILSNEEIWHSPGNIPPAFHQMLYEISQHPENGIHLKDLAERYHMHPTYISNRFKHHFGITPARFHREVVIEKACGMLRNGNRTITEIAYELGFSDVSAFTQVFTSAIGLPPTHYRRGAGGAEK